MYMYSTITKGSASLHCNCQRMQGEWYYSNMQGLVSGKVILWHAQLPQMGSKEI